MRAAGTSFTSVANRVGVLRAIARGNVLTQVLNGQVMSMVIDDDVEKRMMQGLLGIQLHVGPPMKLEIRNVWLKNL